MKHIFVLLLCSTIAVFTFGQTLQLDDSVIVIEDFKALYTSGDFYFSGQPTLEAFHYLKKQGVKKVINLRSEKENEKFASDAFNEASLAKKLGMEYLSIPIGGKEDYTPESLSKFSEAISTYKGKILIHCKSAGRVSYFMMAYLIKYKDYTADEAVEFGKQITYFNYLESLIGEEMSMDFSE